MRIVRVSLWTTNPVLAAKVSSRAEDRRLFEVAMQVESTEDCIYVESVLRNNSSLQIEFFFEQTEG